MKTIFIVLSLLLFAFIGHAQHAAIAFESTSWSMALQKARQARKPVFVYAYSPGCHFCQKMERTTLHDVGATAYYNATFISFKVNVEADTAFARRYDIDGFPTYLYLDSTGTLLHRSSGEKPAVDFIADAYSAFQPQTAFYELQRQYQAGNRNASLLYRYSKALEHSTQHQNPQAQVFTEYLATQSAAQLQSEHNLRYIFGQYTAPAEQYILLHQTAFQPYFSIDDTQRRAYQILAKMAFKAGINSEDNEFRQVQLLARTNFADTIRSNAMAVINFWEGRRDWVRYAQATRRYSQHPNPDRYTLQKTATYLYYFGKEQGSDRQQLALREVLEVLPVLLKQERSYENLLLYAKLLQQAHRPIQAKQLAQEALAKAQQQHETGEEAATLLATLRNIPPLAK